MAQTTFSIRMDCDLKTEFDKLCEEFGMSMSTAINVFARAVVRERRIPFTWLRPMLWRMLLPGTASEVFCSH